MNGKRGSGGGSPQGLFPWKNPAAGGGVLHPLDYGYLEDTQSADGGGVDAWLGSLPDRKVTAIVCTVDLEKRDAEVKILLGCTPKEAQEILRVHNSGPQAGLLVERRGA